jgi:putative radical SAM enzyme (TIGR03279 family)
MLITGAEGPAAKAGIKAGGRLVSIEGEPVLDFVDYSWFSARNHLTVIIETDQGRKSHKIVKKAEEPIGLSLEGLYPDEKRCANRCIFCFVDQMPAHMRESLYVKDDDWRYSVLFGNYITLTNVSESEFERILRRKPSPLYVSVHTTDPDLRPKMMGNPRASLILPQLKRLAEAGIVIHCQIVLVPGVNGEDALKRTLSDLNSLYPGVRTVAVVPLGLTCHRQGLAELKPVGKAEALRAVEIVENFESGRQDGRSPQRPRSPFAFASDEMYLRAGLPAPRYRGGEYMPQLANGVGLISDLLDGFEWALGELPDKLEAPRDISIVTGVSAFPLLEKIATELERRVGNLSIHVIKAENRLFGKSVTVAGLLCGADIAAAAEGKALGQELLIPQSTLRAGEDVFLDGMTVGELADRLGTRVRAVPCDGAALAYASCGMEEDIG